MRMSNRELSRRIEALEASRTDLHNCKMDVNITPYIADCYIPVHQAIAAGEYSFINLPGGRGSGKSSYCSLELVSGVQKDPEANALVIRKFGTTLRGSVVNQVQWAIDILGVSDDWKLTIIPLQFVHKKSGQVIRFSGLDDPMKLKSLKPTRGFFKFLWVEEFCEISGAAELRNLQQSVLRGGDRFVVLRSYNPPISAANWANQFVQQDDRALTVRTDYTMVPESWLGDLFLDEAERLKRINPRAYQHEYLGLPVGNGSEVFPNLEIRKITDQEIEQQSYLFRGLDFGFAQDPMAFVILAYDRKHDTLFFIDEIVKKGCSNLEIATLIQERGYDRDAVGNRQRITADAAEPKSIADLQDCGLKVSKCRKFPGCVQYRVKWLQHRRIVIDPDRTPVAAKEFQNYSYVVDRKTGEITSELPDKDNHCIDACAYALDRLIYRKGISA